MLANSVGHIEHILQVGRAILIGRCSHANKNHLSMLHSHFCIGGKFKIAISKRGADVVFQARLIDGYMAGIERVYFFLIYIDTDYLIAYICKTGPGDKTDITTSKDCNSQNMSLFKIISCFWKFKYRPHIKYG